MSFCLPKKQADKFLEALRGGKIVPEDLMAMSSAQRRSTFSELLGEEFAKDVNASLESKLILKDQKKGMVTWAKKLSGITEATRTDIISKIERLDKVLSAESEQLFLEDLASKRIGADITFEEAKTITEMAQKVTEKKELILEDSPIRSKERLDYGLAYTLFQDYVNGLKGATKELSWKEWATSPSALFDSLGGTTKSLLSSMDNSFFGRQGIKILYTNPSIWASNFLKSWGDIGKELRRIDAMQAIKADVFSRPNALNGKYEASKLDIGIASEEAYPTAIPGRIPVLGRLYNASQSAFSGAALRMRADYFDKIIERAESFGVDMLNKEQASGVGQLVNSMTGRGKVNLTEGQARFINLAVFSIRFFKSNFDTLTAHRLGFGVEKGPARSFVRRQAAENLAKMVLAQAAILNAANLLWPGSVDFDPRSSRFGKIKIGDTTFDISGGMASLITLAARISPTMHNGKWGFWSKNQKGKYTNLTAGEYGQQDAVDVIDNFWQGKLSPIAGVLRDVWRGQDFDRNKPSLQSIARNLITPIPWQNLQDTLNNPDAAPILSAIILDGLGISANTSPK